MSRKWIRAPRRGLIHRFAVLILFRTDTQGHPCIYHVSFQNGSSARRSCAFRFFTLALESWPAPLKRCLGDPLEPFGQIGARPYRHPAKAHSRADLGSGKLSNSFGTGDETVRSAMVGTDGRIVGVGRFYDGSRNKISWLVGMPRAN